MRSFRSAAAAVLAIFGTMQIAASEPMQAGAAAPQAPNIAQTTTGAINGNAVTSSNGQAAEKTVRLRDTQSGQVVASDVTDHTGAFAFTNVDPGTYIVEVLGENQSVVAATSVLTLHAGEVVATVVKLPLLVSGGFLGSAAAMATVVAAGAAAAGVLAVNTVGDPTCPR